MQYTLRRVPEEVDRALRRRALEGHKSINQLIIELLSAAVGEPGNEARNRDLGDLAGAWEEDPGFEAAVQAFEAVDEELWR